MKLIVHEGNPALPDDVVAARELVHPATMEAEGPLHDLGAISIVNSDSQGMGRIGETVRRTFQLAHAMKAAAATGRSDVSDRDGPDDNERVLRYLAKVTEEPARVHGISHEVGSLAPGPLADLVLWEASSFGVKPVMVFKGGVVGVERDRRGQRERPRRQPTRYGPDWGATGGHRRRSPPRSCRPRRSTRASRGSLGTRRRLVAVTRHAIDPPRRPRPEPDGAGDRGLAAGRDRDPRRPGAPDRSGDGGAALAPLPARLSGQSRFRIASAAISKYSRSARSSGFGRRHRRDRVAHVQEPSVPLRRPDRRTARAASGAEGGRARRRRSWARPSTARGTTSGAGWTARDRRGTAGRSTGSFATPS